MRIVLDTNILVRANGRATGPARELLLLIVRSPGHTLLLSPFLLNELERVFSYDRVRRVTRLNEDEVGEYLGYLRAKEVCKMVFPGPAPQVVASDPDDDPVVHTAVAGHADILCTLNRDFYHPNVVEYCSARGVLISSGTDLLNFLRSEEKSHTEGG